jgi:anthranilate phosphoribosyltransferase
VAGRVTAAIDRFASYIATLGRGPGRSRALTRAEAQDAMEMLLAGAADPVQIGAFLMLLRYRGEDPEEITGLVLGAGQATALPGLTVALDWPSYGAGRTRHAPWFLLSALALGQAGIGVLMHGTNAFSGGMSVTEGLAALGLAPALTGAEAGAGLAARGFAYVPMAALCPAFDALLGLRQKLGLRSPLNTVARLLNPARAACGVDGVFHPPYIETHLAVAERLAMGRLLVLKGGGGEAERNPAKPTQIHLWDAVDGRREITAPAYEFSDPAGSETAGFAAIWHGTARHDAIEARIIATIALGLMAMRRGGDAEAKILWQERRREP